MKLTRKCAGCKQDIRKDEMLEYFSTSGKTSNWYCKTCYEEKLARERFQNKVCEIFGLKSPGPIIWTQRKRLRATYGYTDDSIINCLDYIYNIKHMQKLAESLGLVNPRSMEEMRRWKAEQNAKAGSIAAAIANTEMKEYIVPVQEKKKIKKEINLDDALL